MSNDAFGYRFLRNAGLVGARGLWLGVGIGAATVLAVTALARKGVRKVATCAETPSETAAAPGEATSEQAPVRAVKTPRKTRAKAQDVPVRAVRAKRQPKAEVPEATAETPAAGEPAANPTTKRKRAAKPAEPSSQP